MWKRARTFVPWGLRRLLMQCGRKADIIHSHGVWLPANNTAARAARSLGRPHVISPRGQLMPESLRRGAGKKTLARRLYADRNLRGAVCFHATTQEEADAIRALKLTAPIAVIPVGIKAPSPDTIGSREAFDERWPALRGKRVLLFLSRLHPTKGIMELAQAWCEVFSQFPEWHLLIGGPDEMGHRSGMEACLAQSRAAGAVTFAGSIPDELKWAFYGHAELLVLPSYTENFELCVGEALASGTAALTTVNVPWPRLEEDECGWRVPLGAAPLAEKLREVLRLSPERFAIMGTNGRALIERAFDWNHISRETIRVYRWLLGGGDRPACVV